MEGRSAVQKNWFGWIRVEIALLVGALLMSGCAQIFGAAGTGSGAVSELALGFDQTPLVRSGDSLRPAGEVDVEVRRVLYGRVECWNRGDLAAFMEFYWDSPQFELAVDGARSRGVQGAWESYRRRFPSREDMGEMQLSDLDVSPEGQDGARAVGEWSLTGRDGARTHGRFAVNLRRIEGRWLIVADRTMR